MAAAGRLADLLFAQGRDDELRARADAGEGRAVQLVVDHLVACGRESELRSMIEAGQVSAPHRLANVWVRHGRTQEAQRLRRFGLPLDE